MQEFWNLPIPSPIQSEGADPATPEPSNGNTSSEFAALDRQLSELEWMRNAMRQFTPLETQLIGTVLRLAKLAVELGTQQPATAENAPILADLSKREHEILELLLEGKSNRETAEILQISPRTVEVHRGRVMSKTNSPNAVSLVHKIFNSRAEQQHVELGRIVESAGQQLRAQLVKNMIAGMDGR